MSHRANLHIVNAWLGDDFGRVELAVDRYHKRIEPRLPRLSATVRFWRRRAQPGCCSSARTCAAADAASASRS